MSDAQTVASLLGVVNPRRALLPWGSAGQLAISGTGVLVTGHGCITYFSAYETTGDTAATVVLYDGTSANGQVFIPYTLSGGESTSEIYVLHAMQFTEGLYVDLVSGAATGTALVWLDHDCALFNGAQYTAALVAQAEFEFNLAKSGL